MKVCTDTEIAMLVLDMEAHGKSRFMRQEWQLQALRELQGWRQATNLQRAYVRYELLRTFTPIGFKNLWETAMQTDMPFDTCVDNILFDRMLNTPDAKEAGSPEYCKYLLEKHGEWPARLQPSEAPKP